MISWDRDLIFQMIKLMVNADAVLVSTLNCNYDNTKKHINNSTLRCSPDNRTEIETNLKQILNRWWSV